MKKLKRSKSIVILTAICILLVATTLSVCAAEPISSEVEEVTLIFDETGNVSVISSFEESRSGLYTFVEFPAATYTGTQDYSFSLGHACILKIMWGGKYTDSSSGTMSVTLEGPNTWQEFDFTMDGTVRAFECSGNAYTGTLPAGNYDIILWPDDINKQYVSAGSAYSLDY